MRKQKTGRVKNPTCLIWLGKPYSYDYFERCTHSHTTAIVKNTRMKVIARDGNAAFQKRSNITSKPQFVTFFIIHLSTRYISLLSKSTSYFSVNIGFEARSTTSWKHRHFGGVLNGLKGKAGRVHVPPSYILMGNTSTKGTRYLYCSKS